MAQYVISSWRETSGLPVDSVTSIAQTRDGYLWFGTEVGLVRFDGIRFTVFSKENTPAFRLSAIDSLFVSRDGTLWIGTHGGGAVTFSAGRFSRVPTPLRFVVDFAESGDGAMWIGAPGAIARVHAGRAEIFGSSRGYPGGRLTSIAADRSGVYVALPSGVLRIDARGVRKWGVTEGLSGGTVTALRMTGAGLLAGNESGGVDRLDPGASRFVNVIPPGSGHSVTSILEGAESALWMSTIGGGIVRYTHGALERLTEQDGLGSNSVNEIAEDDEGHLWAAMVGGGILRLDEAQIKTFVPREPLSGEWILPLVQARDGSIWFTTNGGGLNQLSGDSTTTRITTANGLLSNMVGALAEARDGSIWVGTDGGLQRIENGHIVQTIAGKEGLARGNILGITVARDGSLWVTTGRTLHHIVNGVVHRLSEKEGLPPGVIVAVREAADGSLWLARPASVDHFADGKIVSFSREDGLQTSSIFSIEIDQKDGSVWVATAGDGLGRIHQGTARMFRAADGLLSDTVYGVVQDRRGNLWVSTNRGLFTFSRSDLARFEAGRSDRITIRSFRKADGLKSSDFSGGFDRPGFRAFDGKLWFPTTRGLVVVDPEKVRVPPNPPRTIIEGILANGVPHAFGVPVEVRRGKRQIEIAYTSPGFTQPELTTFRYILEGFDDGWQEAGTRRTAYYTNVQAGHYRFRVRATNGQGVTSESATSVHVAPQFHETWLFRTAVVLIAALFFLVFLRRRGEALRERQAELRRSEEHFRSLTENGSDMIMVVDPDGVITYASPSVRRALGAASSPWEGAAFSSLLADGADAGTFLHEVETRGHHAAVLLFRDGAGQKREVESIGVRRQLDGQFILNCRDITERRRLEAQLEQANRVSSLGHLAATVAHEFNNVLMGILPFLEIIQRSSSDRTVHKAITHMTQSVMRGKRVTEEILRYTRPAEPARKPLAARDWLLGLEGEIRALAGSNVRVAIIAPSGITLQADPGQLSQVLTNLAINGRDAGATALRIEIGAAEGNGIYPFGIVDDPARFAHLRFFDNGSGIPEAILAKIFEPMFTTKLSNGTGLGLAVAQKVVTMHGGQMFVESRLGGGTTFHLFLPLAMAVAGESAEEQVTRTDDRSAPCRVLLVEDDSVVAEGILMLLESEGFACDLAVCGGDALDMIPRVAPSVIILDVGLPDIDGVELYHRISARWPRIQVIFSTGHGDASALAETLGAPPLLLLKPYSRETLVEAVAAAREAACMA